MWDDNTPEQKPMFDIILKATKVVINFNQGTVKNSDIPTSFPFVSIMKKIIHKSFQHYHMKIYNYIWVRMKACSIDPELLIKTLNLISLWTNRDQRYCGGFSTKDIYIYRYI